MDDLMIAFERSRCDRDGHVPMCTAETVRSLPVPMFYEVVSCRRCGQQESSVQFIRNRGEAGWGPATSAPVGLGFKAVIVLVGDCEVWIAEGQRKVILWPKGVERWSVDGRPRPAPELQLIAQ